MDGVVATYLGNIVSKNNFRVFIYAPNGQFKLVESWEEYQKHMESGLWFPTIEEAAMSSVPVEEKPKKESPKKPDAVVEEPVVDEVALEEKKDDDFLPKKRK